MTEIPTRHQPQPLGLEHRAPAVGCDGLQGLSDAIPWNSDSYREGRRTGAFASPHFQTAHMTYEFAKPDIAVPQSDHARLLRLAETLSRRNADLGGLASREEHVAQRRRFARLERLFDQLPLEP